MAARIIYASPAPVRMISILVETWYSIQNQSPDTRVFIASLDHVPSQGDAAFVLPPWEVARVKQTRGEDVYLWTESDGARLVYDEAE